MQILKYWHVFFVSHAFTGSRAIGDKFSGCQPGVKREGDVTQYHHDAPVVTWSSGLFCD
jgi:hypothetical protein